MAENKGAILEETFELHCHIYGSKLLYPGL